jgi:cupin fold WbuC family metalloprotein
MRTITQAEINALVEQAGLDPRKRVIYRLHEHHEPVQRMVNAIVPGSYIPPHKHENPDKVELFCILVGQAAILHFDDLGHIENVFFLDAQGPVKIVDIPPRTYHGIIALEPTALLEIIQGPYDAATHKQRAPWSPAEDSPKVPDYLIYLESIVDNWLSPRD